MDIKSIAIIGAGAMGAAYAAMFIDAGGFSVSFIASGERYRRLTQSPMTVNGKPYRIPVVDPKKAPSPAHLIIVALKHHHMAGALNDIKALAGPESIILSVMNGLESEEIIGAACGMDKMVTAIAVGIDAVREAGRFTFASPGKILFGAGPGGGKDPSRLARLQAALNQAGIANEIPAHMQRTLWWKFMINVGINQASAVLRAPYGVFQRVPDAAALMTALMREVVALAQAIGIALDEKAIDDWRAILPTLSPAGKTSMLQDIEAGRKTEVEIFAGKVVSIGRELKIPTPVNETILQIIRVMETSFS
ncbi:MAG: 2-dehydropantoate 2-reductase [Pseudomonadota bacterium]